MQKITVLGINGRIGHWVARAFAEAGWQVSGFGRSNKKPIPGVRFVKGDAESLAELTAACAEADVVFNGLNLPYDKWFDGRLMGLMERVVEAMGKSGKTLLYPGSVYNYAANARVLMPETEQAAEKPRGVLRIAVEAMMKRAAERGDIRLIVVRAGDFYAPEPGFDYLNLLILRNIGKGKIARLGPPEVGHAWAYLPDLAKAFVAVATIRDSLSSSEFFHFAGHFVTNGVLTETIGAEAGRPLRVSAFPWWTLRTAGLFSPVMRDIAEMRYLWSHPLELADRRLAAILGEGFGTPFPEALRAAIAPSLSAAG